MFKVTDERIVKNWPVDVVVPIDGGDTQRHPIKVDLKITDTVDANKVLMGQEPELKMCLVGWEGIANEIGEPIEFSESARDTLLKNPHFTQSVVRAYQDCVAGRPAEKNS
ncbi:hypothetical protein [Vibrio nomapromontoriensis]|uniref:hypothetical protein n=1 Tax=Vibrio nomapromontoriensis TaxID=2910246 RepID=UPI003D0E1B5F